MTEFKFTYNEHEIKFTVDLLGREKVFVNNALVAKSTYSLSTVKKYEIALEGELLTLNRYTASYENYECQVSLSSADKLIDKQTKLLLEFGSDDDETVYKGNEYEWLKEVKLPAQATSIAWVFYFLIILQSFTLGMFGSSIISDVFGWLMVALVSGTIAMFFLWGFKEVFRGSPQL